MLPKISVGLLKKQRKNLRYQTILMEEKFSEIFMLTAIIFFIVCHSKRFKVFTFFAFSYFMLILSNNAKITKTANAGRDRICTKYFPSKI